MLNMCLRRFLMVKVYEVGEVYFDGKAPVPSYEEWKRLQEQLDDANKALKEVCMHCETEQFECRCGWVEPCKDCNAHYSARDYLKKWGVK